MIVKEFLDILKDVDEQGVGQIVVEILTKDGEVITGRVESAGIDDWGFLIRAKQY